MDRVLVDYLNSGKGWLLVGSGPSLEMGYPSWKALAEHARDLVVEAIDVAAAAPASRAIEAHDFPAAIEAAASKVGMPALLARLRQVLVPERATGSLYEAIARWPVSVYLTTNFDDEIQRHLAKLGLGYSTLTNNREHLALMAAGVTETVVKLHGDLTREDGLVLTKSQYGSVTHGKSAKYWRTYMTSVFATRRVIVIGHSLTDRNIDAVLGAAQVGSTAHQPVCWIAPNVSPAESRRWLEKRRIRVISYPSSDDDHRGLKALIDNISEFVIPRETAAIRREIAEVVSSGARGEPAATAVYVFNRLSPHVNLPNLRADVAVAAMESIADKLEQPFRIQRALELLDWPIDFSPSADFEDQVGKAAVKTGIFEQVGVGTLRLADAQRLVEHRAAFEHLRDGFIKSLELAIRRHAPDLGHERASQVAEDINESLTGFFRRGGLTLATIVFSGRSRRRDPVPASVIGFISEASARYEDLASRHAFWSAALAAFVESSSAVRAYLGKVAQGFFAFHALGAFGDAALERRRTARDTVWLLDSNLQIPSLALGAPSNRAYVDALLRLKEAGIRVFTTTRLFNEAIEHFNFARLLIGRVGPDSPYVIAAANGDAPYWRQNEFLQGFIRWQAAGNPSDWPAYLFDAFGTREPDRADVAKKLTSLGVEIVPFDVWPGFSETDFADREAATDDLKALMRKHRPIPTHQESDFERYLDSKIPPEAEAAIVVRRERAGKFHILSEAGAPSPSWFISATSIINALDTERRITWQPEAFLAFVGTLVLTPSRLASADHAFEVVLWSMAQSGLTPIPESTVERVFGRVLDEAELQLDKEHEELSSNLGEKYGEAPEDVVRRLPPSQRLMATLQLNVELAQRQEQRVRDSEAEARDAKGRATKAEKELSGVARLRRNYAERQARAVKKRRAAASNPRKKRR